MRFVSLCILVLSTWGLGHGQELVTIRDTVNHFSIGVPVGWRYGIPADKSVAFIALRQKLDDQDLPRENFNINIVQKDETDLDKSYQQFLESVGKAEGFSVIDQGTKIIADRQYRYLVETHLNRVSKEAMSDYVLFTNKEGQILILTMVTTSANFERYRELFEAIGMSLVY